uniref:Uncharacterized protein n=1 Tax=Arundo donax TaxID=35708 RepID=A0A0A9I073_ARUDO
MLVMRKEKGDGSVNSKMCSLISY